MLRINNLNITYKRKILENVEFIAGNNSVTLIKGESGSGKTSLLYRISLLANQDDYEYLIDDIDIMKFSISKKALMRKHHIAYVLQDSLLLNHYNIYQNLCYCAKMVRKNLSQEDAKILLQNVELSLPLDKKVRTLSGGERQRVAIACALAKDCEIMILDEPTSSLDKDMETRIFELIQKLAHEKKKCIILASHSAIAQKYADSIYKIENNRLNCVQPSQSRKDINLSENENKIKIRFLFEYVKDYLKVYKKKELSNIFITAISFLLIFITVIGIYLFQEKSQESLLKISDNQLYVSTSDNGEYVKQENQLLAHDEIFDILTEENENILAYYPYIYSFTDILGERIDIIPYFKENKFDDKYEYEYNRLEDGPILSYETYQLLKRNNISYQFITTTLVLRFDQNGTTKYKEEAFSLNVKGVLKEGQKNHYSQNNYYIAVPYEYLKSIYPVLENQEYIGYTIFAKDFASHTILNNHLKGTLLSVNDTFQNTENINKVIGNSQFIKNMLLLVIIVGTLFILSLMSIHNFGLRKKEFVISIITGLSYKDIVKMGFIESVIQNMTAFMLSLGIGLISLIFIKIKILWVTQIIGIVCLDMILIILLISLLNFFQMKRLSVENVLRN